MNLSPKVAFIGKECVACGCCVLVCPRNAIRVVSGTRAQIEDGQCVGCGKCAKACPAGVISVVKRSAE